MPGSRVRVPPFPFNHLAYSPTTRRRRLPLSPPAEGVPRFPAARWSREAKPTDIRAAIKGGIQEIRAVDADPEFPLRFDPGGCDEPRRVFTLALHEARELGLRGRAGSSPRARGWRDTPLRPVVRSRHVEHGAERDSSGARRRRGARGAPRDPSNTHRGLQHCRGKAIGLCREGPPRVGLLHVGRGGAVLWHEARLDDIALHGRQHRHELVL